MVNEIIETILQIFIFSLIPFLVFVIKKRTVKGFLDYIGLKKSNSKANSLAILASLILLAPMLLLTLTSDSFQEIMFDPNSITGKLRAMDFGPNSIFILLIIAIFKTSFAEEILFRGFIAKRLISSLGFIKGNIIQAVIFGILHTVLFAMITTNFVFLSLIFIFPTVAAYVFGYLNEKKETEV
jgi:membrane protease YdiL (CAAX protease family)